MRTFTLYVQDDRYSVPTLVIAVARNLEAALVMARQELERSLHHGGIEVREGDELVGRVERITA